MKRGLVVIGICLSIILIGSFVSASWFGDLFEITGKSVEDTECVASGYKCFPNVGLDCNQFGSYYESATQSCGNRKICCKPVIGMASNEKRESRYFDKEVFLISDKNWKDVLPLVSLTTWTGNEDWCQEGYGTAEDVCVYPTLIYHEEDVTLDVPPLEEHTFYLSDNEIRNKVNENIENSLFEFKISSNNVKINNGEIEIDVLYSGNEEFLGTGEASDERLVISDNKDLTYYGKIDWEDYHKYFIVSNDIDKKSYLLRAKIKKDSYRGDMVTIEKKTSSGWTTVFSDFIAGDVWEMFGIKLHVKEVSYISGNKDVTLSVEDGASFNKIYDAKGNYIILPSQEDFPMEKYTFEIWGGENPYNSEINYQTFDVDSIIYFMQHYTPNRVTIIGETPKELDNLLIYPDDKSKISGAGLRQNQIQRISTNDYLSYWKEYKDVVYVEDDYELALLASTYASLKNIPLIIEGGELDRIFSSEGRNIICVKKDDTILNIDCNPEETYNLEELQKKYVEETNTDKVVLINPNDLDIKVEKAFTPDKSKTIYETYTETSLVTPILASAKHELIVGINHVNSDDAKSEYESKLNQISLNPIYLTLFVSPNSLEMSRNMNFEGKYVSHRYIETDSKFKSITDKLNKVYVGRIFGVTSSDNSAYVSRVLFSDEINSFNSSLVISMSEELDDMSKLGISKLFEKVGLNPLSLISVSSVSEEAFEDKEIIVHSGHGGGGWTAVKTPLSFKNSIIFDQSCLACPFEEGNWLLCTEDALRRGAILYFGASTDSVSGTHHVIWLSKFLSGETAGISSDTFEIWPQQTSVLLGDPTFKLPKNIFPKSSISKSNNEFQVNLKMIGFQNHSGSKNLFSTNGDELTMVGSTNYGYPTFITVGPFEVDKKYRLEGDDNWLKKYEEYVIDNEKYFNLYYRIRMMSNYEPNYSGEFYNHNIKFSFLEDSSADSIVSDSHIKRIKYEY